MGEFDDEFLLRPGRVGANKGQGRSFLGQVRRATQLASGTGYGLRGGGGRTRNSLARGQGRGRSGAASRRVTVVGRIVRHAGSRYRAAPLTRHIAYLERDGVTHDGEPAHMFGATTDNADIEAFAERCEPDRHHFRFIVSPADAGELADLRAFARDLMRQAEDDLGTRLDWVAVDHWNTDNPHLHILVRGKADDGRDLVIAGDYMGRGLRERAQALATLELGPRSEREIAAAIDKEVSADRWTSLDGALRRLADREGGVADLRDRPDLQHSSVLIGRATHLESLGLAERVAPGRWRLAQEHEDRLRMLSERGDIIKTMHRAMARGERPVEPARFAIHPATATQTVVGRLVERGLRDELTGTAYAVVDGVDGRQHHLAFADLGETGDARPGAIVEYRAFTGREGRAMRMLEARSDLPLEAQVTAEGATWLDRQLLRRDRDDEAGGFGQEVADALGRRAQVLARRGLAWRRGDQLVPTARLLDKLKARELAMVTANLAAETGLVPRQAAEGEAICGLYRRRLDLASGRFAMIDDGMGFQLAPWRAGVDARLGREVSGVLGPGGSIQWNLGRSRGPGR